MRKFDYNRLKETDVFKKAKYVKYIDIHGNPVPEEKAIRKAPIVLYHRISGGGLLVKLWICSEMPNGFKELKGALTAPVGFRWVYNGKSLFGGNRRVALLRTR